MGKPAKSRKIVKSEEQKHYVECEFSALFTRLTTEFGNEEMWLTQKVIYNTPTREQIQKEVDKWRENLPDEILTKNMDKPFTFNHFEASAHIQGAEDLSLEFSGL